VNNFYEFDSALEKIAALKILHIEYGIVLVRQSKYEEGIPKIIFSEFPSTLKLLKQLMAVLPEYDFIYLAFKCIISDSKELLKYIGDVNLGNLSYLDSSSIESIIIFLLDAIKDNYTLLNVNVDLKILHRKFYLLTF
jgi:hypothetical protein